MVKKIFCASLLLFSLIFLTACYGSWNPFESVNDVDTRAGTLSDLTSSIPASVTGNSGTYDVVVLTDLHYGSTKADCPETEFFAWLDSIPAAKRPKFAISLGDSADTGNQNEYDDYLRFCKKLEAAPYNITMLNVPGNHDLYQGHWENWKKNCYPNSSFYSFRTSKFSWYAIDTASGSTGLAQYKQLKSAFASDPNPKIVYTHYPILEFNKVFGLCDTVERNLLIDLFATSNVKCSLGGHLHYYASDVLDDYTEYCLPSFKYSRGWTVVTVDETAETVKINVITR